MSDTVSKIVRELSERVFGLINRIIGDRDEALDLTQEVFVKVLLNNNRESRIEHLQPYIFRTAFNRALNAGRNRKRRRAGEELLKAETPDTFPSQPDQLYESSQKSVLLKNALDTLADRQKQALTLRFYAQMSLSEIAEAMMISEGSVRVHIARGLQNLKKELLPLMREEKL
ncbi:MAG: sigma-70 family RNA polymerase sigma factor [FCB group bacterium]|nr:sigma-70 family RNA polymerase sigma factor [FCB group bacterium]